MLNETIVTATAPEMNADVTANQVNVESVTADTPNTIMGVTTDKLEKAALFGGGFILGIAAAKAHRMFKDWRAGKAAREKEEAMKAAAAKVVEAVAEAQPAEQKPVEQKPAEQAQEAPTK